MKMKCNTLTILVFLLAGTMLIAAPTKSEFERTIQKDFQIDSDGLVDLSNKYGKVTIETVSGNTVNIEVVIKVDANSQSKADEIFDRIDIDFTNNGSLVKAETTIASQKSKWFSWWGDSKSNSLEINYTVKMPKSCRLSLMNKYGDNFVDHLDGKANISVKYGNLQLAGISGDLDLEMKYAKGSVGSAKRVSLDLGYSDLNMSDVGDMELYTSYSNLNIDEAGDIDSDTKYSNIRIKKVGSIDNEGKYDDFEIESVNSFRIDTKYTDVEIDELSDQAKFNMGYGGARIHKVGSGFSKISIESNYAGFKFGFGSGAGYEVDLDTKYTSVKHGDLNTHMHVEKNSELALKGKRGGGGGLIYARMKYGSLKLLEE